MLGAALRFPAAQPAALAVLAVLLGGGALLASAGIRRAAAGLAAKLLHLFGQADQWPGFAAAAAAVNRPETLLAAGGASALAFLSQVLLLDLTLRALHAPVALDILLLAYTLPGMAGRLTVLPGGLGVTEAGMVGLLAGLGGLDPNAAAAAAALFRAVDSLFQAGLGAAVYFLAWPGARQAHERNEGARPA